MSELTDYGKVSMTDIILMTYEEETRYYMENQIQNALVMENFRKLIMEKFEI